MILENSVLRHMRISALRILVVRIYVMFTQLLLDRLDGYVVSSAIKKFVGGQVKNEKLLLIKKLHYSRSAKISKFTSEIIRFKYLFFIDSIVFRRKCSNLIATISNASYFKSIQRSSGGFLMPNLCLITNTTSFTVIVLEN